MIDFSRVNPMIQIYHNRLGFSAIGLMLFLFGAFSPGCAGDGVPDRSFLFFSPSGEEYRTPSYELFLRLRASSPDDAQRLCDRLAKVLNGEGAYSRLVAADALLTYLDYLAWRGQKGIPETVAKAFAKNVIRIGAQAEGLYTDDDILKTPPEALKYPIHPHCQMAVDVFDIPLRPSLPRGWTAEDGIVELDGVVIRHTEGAYEGGVVEEISLPYFLPGDRLYGEHKMLCRLTVVAPNGTKVPLERAIEFKVERLEDAKRRLYGITSRK